MNNAPITVASVYLRYYVLCITGSDEIWALTTPTTLSWPVRAEAAFFIDVFDWDTVAISRQQSKYETNLLSIKISLCTGLFPCSLLINGQNDGKLYRIGGGSISCQGSKGCSHVKVFHSKSDCYSSESLFCSYMHPRNQTDLIAWTKCTQYLRNMKSICRNIHTINSSYTPSTHTHQQLVHTNNALNTCSTKGSQKLIASDRYRTWTSGAETT